MMKGGHEQISYMTIGMHLTMHLMHCNKCVTVLSVCVRVCMCVCICVQACVVNEYMSTKIVIHGVH